MLKNSLKSPAIKHKREKKSLVPRVICYSDRILLFRLMQNQRNSQTMLSLTPVGWGIHTYVCQHRHEHLWGIPLSRGKWLYHLCHPSGSGADTANPLHMFNVAHAKPWSRASIPQVSPTDVPAAAAVAAGSVLTPGWTSPLQQPACLGCTRSPAPASPGTSERDVTALASKNRAPSSSLALPQPCRAVYHLPGALQQDIRISLNRVGGLYCVRLSPLGGSHSCQCDGLTGRDRQHPSITPLTAWNAAISLAESSSQGDRLHGAVNEANILGDRAAPEGISHSRSCLSRATAPYSSSWREVNKYQSWRD